MSSGVVFESATANGASFTGVTSIDIVAIFDVWVPSEIV